MVSSAGCEEGNIVERLEHLVFVGEIVIPHGRLLLSRNGCLLAQCRCLAHDSWQTPDTGQLGLVAGVCLFVADHFHVFRWNYSAFAEFHQSGLYSP
jgi:hypothetical protein